MVAGNFNARSGATSKIPPSQRIAFTATFSNPSVDLHWFVDEHYIGASKSGGSVFWPLDKGKHRIVCSDGKGKSRAVAISVK